MRSPLCLQLAAAVLGCLPCSSAQSTLTNSTYFQLNSTGFRLQHAFETVMVQTYGYDGFRVRAWPFRPPNGNEVSFLYDPPLEGPSNATATGVTYDTTINGTQIYTLRNGNTLVKTCSENADNATNVRLAFYRIEDDGLEALLTNEYAPLKALSSRYYEWNGPGQEFTAAFSFATSPDEQIYGSGTQQDHMVNKEGNTIELINFNTHVPTPLFMSSRGYGFVWNSASEGEMEFGQLRNCFTSRPLYMDISTTDANVVALTRNSSNVTTPQYMFGPRLLVTPVTLPNVTEWSVYLPETGAGSGTKPWTYWLTNVTYAGGQRITMPAPLEHVPLFHLGSRADVLSGDVF